MHFFWNCSFSGAFTKNKIVTLGDYMTRLHLDIVDSDVSLDFIIQYDGIDLCILCSIIVVLR